MMSYRKQLVEVKKYNHDRVQIRCANQRKSLTDLNAKYKNLIEENKQLRDLLKDIKLFFEECNPHDFTVVADNMDVYLTCINATLGESEEK